MQRLALGADGGKPGGEDEKLFKNQPPARFLQIVERCRKVDRLIGKARRTEVILFLYGSGQNVRKVCGTCIERLTHARAQKLVGNACRKGVDRKNPTCDGACCVRPFKGWVLHLIAAAVPQGAVEAVALAVDEPVFDVGLVEKDEIDTPGFIRHADLDQLHALADARELGI